MNETGAAVDAAVLLEISRNITATLDLQKVLDIGLGAMRRLVEFDGGSIQLVRDGALQMVASDPPAPPEAYAYRLPLGRGFGGLAVRTGEPVYSPDAGNDPRHDPEGRRIASAAGVRSYFAAPLISHGRPVGLVQIDSARVDAFPPAIQARLVSFAPTFGAAVQNALLYAREVSTIDTLKGAETAKRDFLAVVSHELRTPLTSILGLAQTLATHAEDVDPTVVAEFGDRIGRAGRRLAVLIEDLLRLTEIERGGIAVRIGSVDVGAAASTAAREEAEACGREPAAVKVSVGVSPARADRSRLVEVVRRLLENARKFSAPGTPIGVGVRVDGEWVTVEVADRGRGIPEEMLGRLFVPFTQLEPAQTRTAGGLGIGLSIAKRLCDLMGVGISIQNREGGGTVVTLRLARVP